jgi:hypothetical protein
VRIPVRNTYLNVTAFCKYLRSRSDSLRTPLRKQSTVTRTAQRSNFPQALLNRDIAVVNPIAVFRPLKETHREKIT